jgi:hypothetical protein
MTEKTQVEMADLESMSVDQIDKAFEEGRLNQLLGRPVVEDVDPSLPPGPINRADLDAMSPEQVAAAFQEGRFDHLFSPPKES